MSQSRLVILDRDGVINQDSDEYIKSAREWIPIEGSLQAIAKLKEAGFLVAIATNQSGIGRGYFSESVLQEMHQKMRDLLSEYTSLDIDLIAYCPHKPDAGCDCRKPKSGLLKTIGRDLDMGLKGQFMVGDSLKDLQAAVSEGMQPLLVKTGKGLKTMTSNSLPENVVVKKDLLEAVNYILALD